MTGMGSGGSALSEAPARVGTEVTPALWREYAHLTGTDSQAPTAGLWIAVARRAMAQVVTPPPGGVLLSIACECDTAPTLSDLAVDVRQNERPTKDHRRLVRVTCEMGGQATVTFILLLPADGTPAPLPTPNDVDDSPDAGLGLSTGRGPVSIGLPLTRAWSQLTYDRNPLHTSLEFAAESRFGVPIVHGHYLAALVGDRVECESGQPQPWTCDFVAPVPVGARFEIHLEDSGDGLHGAVRHDSATAVRVTTEPQIRESRA